MEGARRLRISTLDRCRGAFIHFGEAHQPGFLLNPPANTTPLPSASDGRTYSMGLSMVLRAPLGPVGLHAKWATRRSRRNCRQRSRAGQHDGCRDLLQLEARETKGSVYLQAGGTYDFGAQWQARFDWDRTESKDNINPKYDVEAYTLGFGYRF